MADNLKTIFSELQSVLQAGLGAARSVIGHPVAKGDASEANWVGVLKDHLPYRYQVDKAFVIDSEGNQSEQIDIVIYDRQYTPVLYNRDGLRIIPAESVYAVIEAKQKIGKGNIQYAGDKAASIRKLVRTSAEFPSAGGRITATPPAPIIAGIVALSCDWKPAFGVTFSETIGGLKAESRIDIGCAVSEGAFDIVYDENGKAAIDVSTSQNSLAYFFIRLLHRLQRVATVPAIDYNAYGRLLK